MIFRAAIALALLTIPIRAGEPASDVKTDDSVANARSLAFDGKRSAAIEMLDRVLVSSPGNSDALVFRGIVLSWQGRYDEARNDLTRVIAVKPGYGDALMALVNVEIWSDHPERAEKVASQGLKARPGDADLLLARARALRAMHRPAEAMRLVTKALEAEPENAKAHDLRESLDDVLRVRQFSLSHTSQWFSDGRTPWLEDQAQFNQQTPAGSVIARFSHADRFSYGSWQGEADWYPHIRPGTYGYVNVGVSPDANLYPRYRVGSDIFQSLGGGFEGSAGFRRLVFGSGIQIYTGAISKYHGNWLFTSRVYLTPDAVVGTSYSMQFSARRYMAGDKDYWSIRGGWGTSPAEIQNITDIGILNSAGATAELSHHLSRNMSVLLRGGVSQEDRVERAGLYTYTCEADLYYRF